MSINAVLGGGEIMAVCILIAAGVLVAVGWLLRGDRS